MPTPQYTALANITLGSSAASVTFSSISQSYRDLVLIAQIGGTTGNYALAYLNGNTTSSNYSVVWMRGTGSAAGSSAGATSLLDTGIGTDGASLGTNFMMNIMDYSATDKHKTVLTRFNTTSDSVWAITSRFASTSAVTSVTLNLFSGSFASGSTFALYGVK